MEVGLRRAVAAGEEQPPKRQVLGCGTRVVLGGVAVVVPAGEEQPPKRPEDKVDPKHRVVICRELAADIPTG